MKVKIEMEIEDCQHCLFTERVYEQGYFGTDCTKLGAYATIPRQGFRPDCPFLKGQKGNDNNE